MDSTVLTWAARGPYIPHPHWHGNGVGRDLVSTAVHGAARGAGYGIGREIVAHLPMGVTVVVIVALVAFLFLRSWSAR